MSGLFDRCLIAGIVLAVGGLILLHKRKLSDPHESFVGEDHNPPDTQPVDDRPNAHVFEYPTHMRSLYNEHQSRMREPGEVTYLEDWKMLRLHTQAHERIMSGR